MAEKLEDLASGDEIVIVKSRWEFDIGRRLIIDRIHADGLIEPQGCPGWQLSADSVCKTSYVNKMRDACHACGVARSDVQLIQQMREVLRNRSFG